MVLIFGVVAHALDLMVPEAIRKKLEPMGCGKVHEGEGTRGGCNKGACDEGKVWYQCSQCIPLSKVMSMFGSPASTSRRAHCSSRESVPHTLITSSSVSSFTLGSCEGPGEEVRRCKGEEVWRW